MAVGTDRQFAEYCRIIGAPELAVDPRFIKNKGRVENRGALAVLLTGPMHARTTAEWTEAFEKDAIPCGPINTLDQVFTNPQVLARGLQIGLTREDGVQVPGVANPIMFSETPVAYEKPAPLLGDGTAKILTDVLGVEELTLRDLRSKGIIG
jgi:crotonobetainyl-CoA:carnitine CoA-transferase CaiB-like acyl-CoA transferase